MLQDMFIGVSLIMIQHVFEITVLLNLTIKQSVELFETYVCVYKKMLVLSKKIDNKCK